MLSTISMVPRRLSDGPARTMRGSDGGPWSRICALPALWAGVLYDAPSLAAAWDLVKD
mgnify:CR=1 FL=1